MLKVVAIVSVSEVEPPAGPRKALDLYEKNNASCMRVEISPVSKVYGDSTYDDFDQA